MMIISLFVGGLISFWFGKTFGNIETILLGCGLFTAAMFMCKFGSGR